MQIRFAVTAKLISAFVFAILIVQSLYFPNPKFQASSNLLWLYSPVCVGPGRKPERWFSHDAAQITLTCLCNKSKNSMQRSVIEVIRTQIQPSKSTWEIPKVTKRQNTRRTYGQPSEQLLRKRWPLRSPHRT